MKTQFTPGPWQVLPEEKDKPYIRIRGTILGAKYKIANALYEPHISYYEFEEATANAHLIAASPTMFDYIKSKAEEGCEDAKSIVSKITNFT